MKMSSKTPSEDEIDEIVTAEADDDSAWEKPILVRRPQSAMKKLVKDQIARLPIMRDPTRRESTK
jgi:hypothetical protein